MSGLSIYDTMRHIRSEVVTVVLGCAASMASLLAAAGSGGRRSVASVLLQSFFKVWFHGTFDFVADMPCRTQEL